MKPFLVFDLDGTLIDSAPDIVVAVNRTLNTYGKNTLSDATIISHIGEGLKKLIADLFKDDHLGLEKAKEVESSFLRFYEEEMFNRTTIFPGVERFLESYKGPVGIITNKNVDPAKKIIEHLKLSRFPWIEVFGADSLAERKPSPLPLQTIMSLAGHTPKNTFMIGDGIPDMVSAQRAGVPSIAITFGYSAPHILENHGAKAFLEHYDKLPILIQDLCTDHL